MGTGLKNLDFLIGTWVGTQNFVDGQKGDVTLTVKKAVNGRYLQEDLTSKVGSRPPAETLHLIGFDPAASKFKAWWYNDTSNAPTEFTGTAGDMKFELENSPAPGRPKLKASYDASKKDELTYTLEMSMGEGWQKLFTTIYHRKR